MAIIVTGASGHFGRAAAEGLLDHVAPSELVLTTRRPERLADLAARGVSVRYGDFDRPDSLAAAFAGGDTMLMISTERVGRRLPQHANAVQAAVAAGVSHVVYTSFIGVDKPGHPALVVKEHRETEELIRASGAALTALRDSQYADAMIEAAVPLGLATGRWESSAGDGKIAFVTRRDCVAAAVAVLTTPGHRDRVYEITGPELLSFRDVMALGSEVTGKPIEFVVVDDEAMFRRFDSLGIPREAVDDQVVERFPWSSNDMVSFERALREGFMEVISDDFEQLTGRKPQSLRSFFYERQDELKAIAARAPDPTPA